MDKSTTHPYNLANLFPISAPVTWCAGEVPRQTPWFEKFEHEFMRMLAFSDLEMFDHPVACKCEA